MGQRTSQANFTAFINYFFRKGRIFSSRFSLMPFTRIKSFGELKPPNRCRSLIIASAMASEMPGRELNSSIVAVLISIVFPSRYSWRSDRGLPPGPLPEGVRALARGFPRLSEMFVWAGREPGTDENEISVDGLEKTGSPSFIIMLPEAIKFQTRRIIERKRYDLFLSVLLSRVSS